MQSPTQEDGVDLIECYFDLEQASLQCELESVDDSLMADSGEGGVMDANMIEFVPVIGLEEDSYTRELNEFLELLEQENERGPFVLPHSGTVFMGSTHILELAPIERTDDAIPKPPSPQQLQQMQQLQRTQQLQQLPPILQPPQLPHMPQMPPKPPGLAYEFQPHY